MNRQWAAIITLTIMTVTPICGSRGGAPVPAAAQRGPDQPSRQSVQLKPGPKFSTSLQVTPIQRSSLDALEEEMAKPRLGMPQVTQVAGPTAGETLGDLLAPNPSDFKIWRDTALSPSGENKDNNEPSVANSGKFVFYTGNKYAARSTDGGATWRYLDPYSDFSNFCCDQDVIYDKSSDLLVWFRLGALKSASNPESNFRIGVSKDAGASFCFWNWRPSDFDASWTDVSWDYPQLALSDNYLYFTINAYRSTGGGYRSILARASLDTLRTCGSLSWTFWTQDTNRFGCFPNGTTRISPPVWTPVQGASDVMYIGQTTTGTCFTVWRQPESSTNLEEFRSSVPAWTVGNLSCPLKNGDDPCKSAGNRVSAGWVAKGTVGFFWTVGAGGGFPMPYVNAATFKDSDLSYMGRPYIWSSNYGWAWAAAYPNKRGDLGVASWRIASQDPSNGYYPQLYVAIDDKFNGNPPSWEIKRVASSTTGPGSDNWGHYLRVRPHAPGELGWIVSGFVSIDKGATKGVSEPHFAIFGRARDESSVKPWLK